MMKVLKIFGGILAILCLGLVGTYGVLTVMWGDSKDVAPEAATGRRAVDAVRTSTTMVVAAHPLATEAGYEILEAGGSAIDAAVAVQAALSLVEPQSSGIAGGAFLLYWDAEAQRLHAYDGRETAPKKATHKLFLNEDGAPMNFVQAVVGGRSVGVPGVLKMLSVAHEAHGVRPWHELFQPAIRLSRDGFEITPRLHRLLHIDPLFRTMPAARAHFYTEDGRAKPVGTRLKNPALATVLEEVAADVNAFYTGPIAHDIVAAVQAAERPSMTLAGINAGMLEMGAPYGIGWLADVANPGLLTVADMEAYTPELREPVCIPYKAYRVCGFPPPTSGGITTLQIIGIMARLDLEGHGPRSARFAHLFAEASRLAFLDRGVYIADPDFVGVPVEQLLAEDYLDARAKLISPDARAPSLKAGKVKWAEKAGLQSPPFAPDASPELPCTSHFVVVDAKGDMVSMTTSVENVFGSRMFVRGFVLNNQLTDFSFVAESDGKPVANAVAPGKRPRSSMSPLIVFDRASGAPVLAIGSPGGSRIIDYTAQATLGVIEFGLSPQEAVELPHVIFRTGDTTELENAGWADGELAQVTAALEAMGHTVRAQDHNSGLHALQRFEGGWRAGIDPRREGAARGR